MINKTLRQKRIKKRTNIRSLMERLNLQKIKRRSRYCYRNTAPKRLWQTGKRDASEKYSSWSSGANGKNSKTFRRQYENCRNFYS